MNKVPRKFLEDKGLKVATDRRMMVNNNPSNQASGMDTLEEYEHKLDNSSIFDYSFNRESLGG